MPGMFQTSLNPECLAGLSLACLDSALDGASFPWGGNSKPICFRSSSFKGLKEQEMSSGNILINSLSSCGQWAGATCVIIKLPVDQAKRMVHILPEMLRPGISASCSLYLCLQRHRCSSALRLLLHLKICLSYFTFQNDWINKIQSLRKYLLNTCYAVLTYTSVQIS